MEQKLNRVVEGMQQWLQKEDNISKLFSPATLRTKYFQELKLDYLRDLHKQTLKGASKDERMTLRILKGEMNQLERLLYPNKLERLIRQLYRSVRNALPKAPEVSIPQRTGWMMRVAHRNLKPAAETSSNKEAITNTQSNKQNQQNTQPLVKKQRNSHKKGQGL